MTALALRSATRSGCSGWNIFVTKLMNHRPAFSDVVIVAYNASMELPMTFR